MAMVPALRQNGLDTTEECDRTDSPICNKAGCNFESIPAPASSSSNVLCDGYDMMAACHSFGQHNFIGSYETCTGLYCNESHPVVIADGTNVSQVVFVNGKGAAGAGKEQWCHKTDECNLITPVYKTTTEGGSPNVFVEI